MGAELEIHAHSESIRARIRYNSWHTKTYCSQHDCEHEKSMLKAFALLVEPALFHVAFLLEEVKLRYGQRYYEEEIKKVIDKWKHRCGESPRWIDIYVYHRSDNKEFTSIVVKGGAKWITVFLAKDYELSVLTDGCFDEEAEEILFSLYTLSKQLLKHHDALDKLIAT